MIDTYQDQSHGTQKSRNGNTRKGIKYRHGRVLSGTDTGDGKHDAKARRAIFQ